MPVEPAKMRQAVLNLVTQELEKATQAWANAKGELARKSTLLEIEEQREDDQPSLGVTPRLDGLREATKANEKMVDSLQKEREFWKETYDYLLVACLGGMG